jgi:tetratricopeptide (TPR) repeat protein
MKFNSLNIKFILGLLITCVLQSPLSAQISKLDSLKIEMDKATVDTLRLDAMLKYGNELRKSDVEAAIELLKSALNLSVEFGDKTRQGKILNSIGICYGVLGQYANAMEYFSKSLEIHREMKNGKFIADAHNNLGNVYKRIGDYTIAQSCYLRSLEIQDSLGNLAGRASALHNIATILDMTGDSDKALEYFAQVIEIYKSLNDSIGQSNAYHSIGLIYRNQGKLDQAMEYLNTHLHFVKNNGDRISEASALNTLGQVYLSKGINERANELFLESLHKSEELNLKQGMVDALYNLADLNFIKKNYSQAISYMQRHLQYSIEMESLQKQKEAHEKLAEYFIKSGNIADAFNHTSAASKLKDQLYAEEKADAFQKWQARFEMYEKDLKLKAQTTEIESLYDRIRRDTLVKWLLSLGLILVGISTWLFYQRYKIRQTTNQLLLEKNQHIEKQHRQIEEANKELESRMLRAQINPHFIFNSLGSIQHFITSNEKVSALKYLSKFSSLLRQVLEDSVTNNLVLEEELKLLRIYLELEALRFEDGFTYQISTDPSLDIYNLEVPVLLIQPFIENSILHGLLPKAGDRKLDIHYFQDDNWLSCRIRDNGIGRAASGLSNANRSLKIPSRGLEVTGRRLCALNPDTSLEDLIKITDLKNDKNEALGTEVLVKIIPV